MALNVFWMQLYEIQEHDMTQNVVAKIERDQLHGIDPCQKQLAIGTENDAVHNCYNMISCHSPNKDMDGLASEKGV